MMKLLANVIVVVVVVVVVVVGVGVVVAVVVETNPSTIDRFVVETIAAFFAWWSNPSTPE